MVSLAWLFSVLVLDHVLMPARFTEHRQDEHLVKLFHVWERLDELLLFFLLRQFCLLLSVFSLFMRREIGKLDLNFFGRLLFLKISEMLSIRLLTYI